MITTKGETIAETKKIIEIFKSLLGKKYKNREDLCFLFAQKIDEQITGDYQCQSCKGLGKTKDYKFSHEADKPETWSKCKYCESGIIKRESFVSLLRRVSTSNGGRFRIKKSKPDSYGLDYYFWRMFRFHSGLDVTMPMTASLMNSEKLQTESVDTFSLLINFILHGYLSGGAARWSGLLGGGYQAEKNLPESARSLGPVLLDDAKPEIELGELR